MTNDEIIKSITTVETNMKYISETMSRLDTTINRFMDTQGDRQIKRDKECAIHTREIAVMDEIINEHEKKISLNVSEIARVDSKYDAELRKVVKSANSRLMWSVVVNIIGYVGLIITMLSALKSLAK